MLKRIKDFLYSDKFDNLMLIFSALWFSLLSVLLIVLTWILFTVIF